MAALECLLVDIDGFSGQSRAGRTVMIPREIGFARLRMGPRPVVLSSLSLYFRGGLATEFSAANAKSLRYQARSVHGYPLGNDDLVRVVPACGILLSLPDEAEEAAAAGEASAAWRLAGMSLEIDAATPLVLVHKGGPEGAWLSRLAAQMAAVRRGAVTVCNLDDFACPKVDELLRDAALRARVERACACSMAVHSRLARKRQKWCRHCPQAECLALAAWVGKTCTADRGRLERPPTVGAVELDALVARACRRSPAPAPDTWAAASRDANAHARCRNYVRAALQREKEHASDAQVERAVLRWSAAVRRIRPPDHL
jgi:hypothetical protein